MLRHDGSLFLVAVDGDAVMGAYDGPRGWVYHLAVTPEQRKAGIGRLLMESLEQRMRERGVAKVNLQVRADNIDVVAFYDGLGYADEPLTSMGKRVQAYGTHVSVSSLVRANACRGVRGISNIVDFS